MIAVACPTVHRLAGTTVHRIVRGHWCAAFLDGASIQQICQIANTIPLAVEAAIRRGLARRARGRK